MADISLCNGEGCLARTYCKRYITQPDSFMQSYIKEPCAIVGDRFVCEYFWDDEDGEEGIDIEVEVLKEINYYRG